MPLILCGPIVRRVDADLICVWVAMKAARRVKLELYAGLQSPSRPDFPEKQVAMASPLTYPFSLGPHLHLALVVLPTNGLLPPNSIFSYNLLFFENNTEKENLISEGLLEEPVLLGFKEGQLPSFVTPPGNIEELRIAHGSCRKPHGRGRDGLAALAKVIEPAFCQTGEHWARPHVFFHTGDQIYADDVSSFLIELCNDAGNFLFQKIEQLPFPEKPEDHYVAQAEPGKKFVWIDATSEALPPNRRATNFYSGFTGDQSNHLYSLAEFCAAYLFQWSDVLWPAELPSVRDVFKSRVLDLAETRNYLFPLKKNGPDTSEKDWDVPENWNDLNRDDRLRLFDKGDDTLEKGFKKFEKDNEKSREIVLDFQRDLPAARRVMANVSNIMTFDDHDVTDDWYLTGRWSKRALGTRLGETIIRNGLLAFALFQASGNDPLPWITPYTAQDKLTAQLRLLLNTFKAQATPNPVSATEPAGLPAVAQQFNLLLGFNDLDNPPVKWHFAYRLGPAHVLGLDTRTRRDFSAGLDFPPNLLRKKALEEQIPTIPPAFGTEVFVVLSGAPILGLAAIEAIGQTIIPRVLNVIGTFKDKFDIPKREASHKGEESLDVEHWSIHAAGYEALLKRLAGLGKPVVCLSGDVHYGITSQMDYWQKGQPEAARFVQMVSSSLKNIKPEGQLLGLLPTPLTQTALAGGLNRDLRDLTLIGWEDQLDSKQLKFRLQFEPGQFRDARPGDYPVRLGAALGKVPVFLPLRDWPLAEFPPPAPGGEPMVLPRIVLKKSPPEPTYRWRLNIVQDERPDQQRFSALGADGLKVDPDRDLPTDPADPDYQKTLDQVLRRNAFFSRTHISRTVNWYSHAAVVRFVRKADDELFAQHAYFFYPQLPSHHDHPGKWKEPFLQHEVSLKPKPASERPSFPVEP
ncbi:MAG: hypothetical protein NW241_15490 [Bacteroidia bacterium]|nr:hypothetical protein [Bacteroidia bacterium]